MITRYSKTYNISCLYVVCERQATMYRDRWNTAGPHWKRCSVTLTLCFFARKPLLQSKLTGSWWETWICPLFSILVANLGLVPQFSNVLAKTQEITHTNLVHIFIYSCLWIQFMTNNCHSMGADLYRLEIVIVHLVCFSHEQNELYKTFCAWIRPVENNLYQRFVQVTMQRTLGPCNPLWDSLWSSPQFCVEPETILSSWWMLTMLSTLDRSIGRLHCRSPSSPSLTMQTVSDRGHCRDCPDQLNDTDGLEWARVFEHTNFYRMLE